MVDRVRIRPPSKQSDHLRVEPQGMGDVLNEHFLYVLTTEEDMKTRELGKNNGMSCDQSISQCGGGRQAKAYEGRSFSWA